MNYLTFPLAPVALIVGGALAISQGIRELVAHDREGFARLIPDLLYYRMLDIRYDIDRYYAPEKDEESIADMKRRAAANLVQVVVDAADSEARHAEGKKLEEEET